MPAKKKNSAEPIATPSTDDAWEWTKTFVSPATAGEERDFRPDLWQLECAPTKEEFHQRLTALIRRSGEMTDQERQWLAEAVEKPWRKKQGAGRKERRHWEIVEHFFVDVELGGTPSVSRARAVEQIAAKFKMELDAAKKAYDLAMNFPAGVPSVKSRKKAGSRRGNKSG